jgi:hypothetical protein
VVVALSAVFALPAVARDIHFARGHETAVATTMAKEMPLFEVTIPGQKESLWFLIDTGSAWTLLDTGVAARLGIRAQRQSSVTGAGGGVVNVSIVDDVTFRIGGLTSSHHEVRLTDLSGLEPLFGHRIDGFFGYDLLARVVTTIDPAAGRIVFTDPAHFRRSGKGATLPITFGGKHGRWIYVPGTIKVPGQPARTDSFFVDSGSSDGANHPLIRKSTAPLRTINTGVGLGAAGGSGVLGRAEWFRLGPYAVKDVSSSCCPPLAGTDAQIGQSVLQHFKVTYDYSRKRMIVQRR